MFYDIDMALRALLGKLLPDGTKVSFDAPDKSWAAGKHADPAIDAFLYKVCEDTKSRVGSWVDDRDRNGRLAGRQPPVRHYQVWYLITAWGSTVEHEHMLLSYALAALATQDTIPAGYLSGALAEADGSVNLSVANPDLLTAPQDIWSALGIAPRAALDLVVTATLVPAAITDLAPPVKKVDLGARTASRPTAAATERRAHAPKPVGGG